MKFDSFRNLVVKLSAR